MQTGQLFTEEISNQEDDRFTKLRVFYVGNLIVPSRIYFVSCSNHLYLFNFIISFSPPLSPRIASIVVKTKYFCNN